MFGHEDLKETTEGDGVSFQLATRTSIRELSEEIQEALPPDRILDLISAIVGIGYEETEIDNTSGIDDVDFAVKTIETLVRQTLNSGKEGAAAAVKLDKIFRKYIGDRVLKDL